MLHNIMEQVMINCNGQDTEYKWVKAEPLQDPLKPKVRKKRTKTLQNSFGKKTGIKEAQRRRSRSAGANTPKLVLGENVKPGPGMPWRTAQRANRYRGYPPDDDSPTKGNLYENITDVSASPQSSPGGAHVHIDYSSEEETTDTLRAYRGSRHRDDEDDRTTDRELQVELEHLRRRFREEKNSRAVAEEKVIEMTQQNKRLQVELEEFKTRRSILDDDRVLESIEASFKQFHAFLDLVRNAGLGQLITLAGIDQSQMAIPLSSPQRQSLGGRLSSSFIKPRKLDMTYSDPVLSPERSFQPIPNGLSGIQGLSAIHAHQSTYQNHSDHDFTALDHLDQSKNMTANTTGVSSDGDLSLPVPGSGLTFPHITPDNFKSNSDPTLPTAGVIAISSLKPKSRFDELYQKVLRETEGALTKTAGDSMDSTAISQSGLNYSEYNGTGDVGHLEKSHDQSHDQSQDKSRHSDRDRSRHSERDYSRHSDHGALSDGSHHSHGSRGSGGSRGSHGSRGSQKSTSKEASRDTVIQQRSDPDNTMEKFGLDPDDLIVERHSDKSKSDKSDISDIEEIQEELSIPSSRPKPGYLSDDSDEF